MSTTLTEHATETRRRAARLPSEVSYRSDVAMLIWDVCTALVPDYEELWHRFPCADGLRDISILDGSGTPTDVDRLLARLHDGVYNYVSIAWLLYLPHWVVAAEQRGKSPRAYADEIYDRCQRTNAELGFRGVWIDLYGEVANSIQWPMGKTFTKREALRYLRSYMTDGRALSGHWKRMVDPATISFYTDARARADSLRELPVKYTDGALAALHEAYRLGFPLVMYESQCHAHNPTQAGIAFARGGAKQWDAFWGVDFSPWGPVEAQVTITTEGRRYSSQTPDHLERSWLTAYLSGSNFTMYEHAHRFFYARTETGKTLLSDYGHAAMRVYGLVEGPLAERGAPVAPFAMLLEEANGYGMECCRWHDEQGHVNVEPTTPRFTSEPEMPVWAGVTELQPEDVMVHRCVQALWPQASEAWQDAWPDGAEADHPPDEMGARLRLGLDDPRRYNRYLHHSAWADAFDFVNETIDPEVLQRFYKAVFLVGGVRVEGNLFQRLQRYVEQGGHSVVCLDQLDTDALRQLGLRHEGTGARRLGYTARRDDGTTFSSREWVWLLDVAVAPADATVTCADDKTGAPFVLDVPQGNGRWSVVMVPHGMTMGARGLAAVYRDVIDRLYAAHVGVRYEGAPVQMIVNRRREDVLLTLLNHTSNRWEGSLKLDGAVEGAVHDVYEVTTGQSYPEHLVQRQGATVRVPAAVEPFNYRLLAFSTVERGGLERSRQQSPPVADDTRYKAVRDLGAAGRIDEVLPSAPQAHRSESP
ncbi:MAG: hypothetical protein ACODAQ_06410 [Phycisphaeraceae bacterium]